ncbi:MAG: MoxR family ATPase [Verrucomicrobia bacterium]|nr:MoxR family ATPase [Verrucomicrobiota bacterium]MCH8513223.1 MoxR family ATPase [Kiritimatiellia bacterium]
MTQTDSPAIDQSKASDKVLDQASDKDLEAIEALRDRMAKVRQQLSRVIIGQDDVVEKLLICLLARGHGLLVGVPGLAKTLLIQSLSDLMSLDFSRIQFTPDLMPSDITGTDILQQTEDGHRAFEFMKGPIFANIVLADEINRTPPKTQAALLQAMQEHKISAGTHTFTLDKPFFVLATQNPIEQEGTYPLPEAQLDRFMFLIDVKYPSYDEEVRIARETTGGAMVTLDPVLTGEQIIEAQNVVRRVPVADHVYEHVVKLVRSARPGQPDSPAWVKEMVMWGPGPRALQYLVLGAKARAVLRGSYLVQIEDVDAVAEPVLTHRILTNFHAQSEGVTSADVIARLQEELHKA